MAAVPSPAAAQTAPAPRRQPAPPSQRPDLRVVGPPRHTRRFVLALGVVVAAAIFGVVALHALAAQASFEAAELEAEVADLSARHEELTAEVARLESPDRIRDVATGELGMVSAERPGYVVLDGGPLFDGPGQPRLADPTPQPPAGG